MEYVICKEFLFKVVQNQVKLFLMAIRACLQRAGLFAIWAHVRCRSLCGAVDAAGGAGRFALLVFSPWPGKGNTVPFCCCILEVSKLA